MLWRLKIFLLLQNRQHSAGKQFEGVHFFSRSKFDRNLHPVLLPNLATFSNLFQNYLQFKSIHVGQNIPQLLFSSIKKNFLEICNQCFMCSLKFWSKQSNLFYFPVCTQCNVTGGHRNLFNLSKFYHFLYINLHFNEFHFS